MPELWLPRAADPAGLGRAPRVRPMFDPRPHRNRGRPAIRHSTPEWDNRLIATAVACGMPRAHAEEGRVNPYVRYQLAVLWCHVQDAAEGNLEAKRILDRVRVGFANAGAVSESFSAIEQPADASELESLLGLD